MIKKFAVRAGALTAVFIAAVIVFSYLTNRGNTDMSADMGGATLPRISFTTEGHTVNQIPGYKKDMRITSMRDTVTPVDNFQLEMNLEKYNAEIEKVTWQVYTLDGGECLQQETIRDAAEKETLNFKAEGMLDEEKVLKVILHLKTGEVFYYTRIKNSDDCNYKTCLDFASDFHAAAMGQGDREKLGGYLETTSEGSRDDFHNVTIHSSLSQVTWGNLEPRAEGQVRWEIKECNAAYTSIAAFYQVRCPGSPVDPDALYSVREFFRVRVSNEKIYLMDYDRTMNQIFDGDNHALSAKGIQLGIAAEDLEYQANPEGTIVSFVQDRELWNYDKTEDEMSLVFSFADAENADERNRYNRHEIHIVSVDKDGNTVFTVCGYMNRGSHEGETGVAVYEFNAEKNSVLERAFVPSLKGYDMMKEELGKFVYFSGKSKNLYVMMDGTLYAVDMEADTRQVLVRGLDESQYAASADGHLIAYQHIGGRLNESQEITVLDLTDGKSFQVVSQGEEYVKPIGFIKNDFVYGTLRGSDAGSTAAGQTVYPMYRLQIVNQEQKVVKTYEASGTYILDGFINENMVTLNRVSKNGETYTAITEDYITNNEKEEEEGIYLEAYQEEGLGTVMRLTFSEGIQDQQAKLLKPKQALSGKSVEISFDEAEMSGKYYVYAKGELQGVFDRAGQAVQKADELEGTAVSSRQAYVWERGNRPAAYEVEGMERFKAEDGETTLAACLRQMLKKEGVEDVDVTAELQDGNAPETVLSAHIRGEGLGLRGCTTEEILYMIGRDTPVLAMISPDHAVLLISYNKTNVAYLDPADGGRYSVTIETMEGMVKENGNTFVGYAR